MDVSVNKPFKDKMKELWTEWRKSSDSCRTKKGNLKQPTRQNAIDWVSAAWDSISADSISRAFLHCGISNCLDGSEDHTIRDYIPEIDADSEEDADPFADLSEDDPDELGNF